MLSERANERAREEKYSNGLNIWMNKQQWRVEFRSFGERPCRIAVPHCFGEPHHERNGIRSESFLSLYDQDEGSTWEAV